MCRYRSNLEVAYDSQVAAAMAAANGLAVPVMIATGIRALDVEFRHAVDGD